ncbi:MAG: hypothetical protein ACD_7C00503G0028, partial [uncultured bacterium]
FNSPPQGGGEGGGVGHNLYEIF